MLRSLNVAFSKPQRLPVQSERGFRTALAAGTAHNALAALRLFNGDREKDVRVKFYRDSAAWCPYCQKVHCASQSHFVKAKHPKQEYFGVLRGVR